MQAPEEGIKSASIGFGMSSDPFGSWDCFWKDSFRDTVFSFLSRVQRLNNSRIINEMLETQAMTMKKTEYCELGGAKGISKSTG